MRGEEDERRMRIRGEEDGIEDEDKRDEDDMDERRMKIWGG